MAEGSSPGIAPVLRKIHGRRKGKALRAAQRARLEALLPDLEVPCVAAGAVDPKGLFPSKSAVWLEIGFGAGEHLHAVAAGRAEVGFIGCEPFVNGVAALLGRIEAVDPGNIRIHVGDARDLVDALPDGSIGRVYLLYPDPWPKARHAKRRFAGAENLRALARVMRPGAELRVATDMPHYVEHSLVAVDNVEGLEVLDSGGEPWEGWTGTRYEAKALREGRPPHYLRIRRL
jgi:tRNA (guanine-N7-)-methyltransferase